MPRAAQSAIEPVSDGGDIKTVSFVSLGCPKNLVDSELMLGLLAQDGIAPVGDLGEGDGAGEHDDLSIAGSEQDSSAASGRVTPADAVVINTCGFLEASKQESLGVIREAVAAKQRGEVKRVVVAGCLVQRHRAKLFDWVPGIDAMVGVYDRDRVIEAVRGVTPAREDPGADGAGPKYWINQSAVGKAKELTGATGKPVGLTVGGGKGVGYFESDRARLRLTPRHYAYLRISEGCNQNCTFCTIPSIRGKMRSKSPDAILDEARELMRDGAFELLLIGQDTTSYGDDIAGWGERDDHDHEHDHGSDRPTLASILKDLSDVSRQELGTAWLRLMYAYPSTFSDGMIDAFAELVKGGNLLPYLDMPLQHGSDGMLSAMRRNVTAQQQLELCQKLRERVPGMAIRTTFITGFPGETEADHEALLGFIEEVQFDAVGVFRYSPEPGTPAGRLWENESLRVPEDVVERRYAEIMELQQTIAFEQAAYLAEQFDPKAAGSSGLRFDVLIDRPSDVAFERVPGWPKGRGRGESGRAGERSGGPVFSVGRTYFQAPKIDAVTYVASAEALTPGELVRCTIVGSDGYDLIARPVAEMERMAEKRVSLPVV